MTRLYIVEWDYWHLMAICKTEALAKSCIRNYMETIVEIGIGDEIVGDQVFVIMDSTMDYRGIHSTKESAQLELDGYYAKDGFEVKEVKILS